MIVSSRFYVLLIVMHFLLVTVKAQDSVDSNLAFSNEKLGEAELDIPKENNDVITLATDIELVEEEDDNEEVDTEELEDDDIVDVEDDEETATTYDIDDTPLDNGYYGLLYKDKDQQGDELGEELLVEYDDDDNDETEDEQLENKLLFEDDEEEILDFKNDEKIDLDQLLFEVQQKDSDDNWHSQHDPLDKSATHDDIDQLLAHADDALSGQDDVTDDDGHPDHVVDANLDSLFEEQQQQQQKQLPHLSTPLVSPPDLHSYDLNEHQTQQQQLQEEQQESQRKRSHYKVPLLSVLVLMILLYKVSNKQQGGRSKFFEKEEKGLPLHMKDSNTPDIVSYPSASPTNTAFPSHHHHHHHHHHLHHHLHQQQQQQQQQENQQQIQTPSSSPPPLQQLSQQTSPGYLGRRSSTGRSGVASVGVHGGHSRRISLGHPIISHSIKESKWEDEWDEKHHH